MLEASTIPDIDIRAARMQGELQQELGGRRIRLVVADAVGSVRDLLVDDELKEDFTSADMYDSVEQALARGGIEIDGGR